MTILSQSVADTLAFGRQIGRLAPPGLCLALHGPLGAGKTHLVRGIAAGANVADPDLVSSPTYVLLNIYPARPGHPAAKTVFHLDAYRTHGPEDFDAVGLDELLQSDALVVIEWPERIPELLPNDHLAITLEIVDEDTRSIALAPTGPISRAFVESLATNPVIDN